MQYLLVGWHDNLGNHDNESRINEKIEAADMQSAVKLAKSFLENLKRTHQYDSMQVQLFQSVWSSQYISSQSAVQARPATAAVEAHFQEEFIGG